MTEYLTPDERERMLDASTPPEGNDPWIEDVPTRTAQVIGASHAVLDEMAHKMREAHDAVYLAHVTGKGWAEAIIKSMLVAREYDKMTGGQG